MHLAHRRLTENDEPVYDLRRLLLGCLLNSVFSDAPTKASPCQNVHFFEV